MLVLLWVVAGQYLLVVTKELDSTIIRLCLSKTYVIMNYTVANIIAIFMRPSLCVGIIKGQGDCPRNTNITSFLGSISSECPAPNYC